jgi:ABC-type Fe3+/spermidine/putrescine transport system ATPase subunit
MSVTQEQMAVQERNASLLEIHQVVKSYSGVPALRGVSLDVAAGEILCLLGPSGCGKTTLLRVITGLEQADSGDVLLKGQEIDNVPVHRRGVGMMFQEYALFPHKDVYGNVAFGLRMARLPKPEIAQRVETALELVGLQGFEHRAVHELSGGEQQRVALARSLAPRPRILMLDEPLGSLDRALRQRLMVELRQILKSVGLTALYVTHDQSEAFAVADRVAIMREGLIVQTGVPEAVYRDPATPFVAHFLGMENLLSGRGVNGVTDRVETSVGIFETDDPVQVGQELTVLLRPDAARMVGRDEQTVNRLEGRVEACWFRGAYYQLVLSHESGTTLAFEVDATDCGMKAVGDSVVLSLRPEAVNLLNGNPRSETEFQRTV